MLLKGFFYVVEFYCLVGGGICVVGVLVDYYCWVMGWNDKLIEGFYVVGNLMVWLDNGVFM